MTKKISSNYQPFQSVIDASFELVEQCAPIIVLKHGLKSPVDNPEAPEDLDRFHIITEPEDIEPTIRRHSRGKLPPNIGIMAHPKAGSSYIAIDVDGMTQDIKALLTDLGVTPNSEAWMQQTGQGRGHIQIIYRYFGNPLPRVTRAGNHPVDLISNGYIIVAPSSTHLWEHGDRKGGGYSWIPDKSPSDICFVEDAPLLLVEWWQEQGAKSIRSTSEIQRCERKPKAWSILNEGIPEGLRNDSLVRVAGWLRRHHPQPVVAALLRCINDARCASPLPDDEVDGIVRSVFQYPQITNTGRSKPLINPFGGQYYD